MRGEAFWGMEYDSKSGRAVPQKTFEDWILNEKRLVGVVRHNGLAPGGFHAFTKRCAINENHRCCFQHGSEEGGKEEGRKED